MSLLVTIVVPCYNAQEYVEETLNSLLSQTYKNIEIIAINDGSTDRTGEIIDRYSDRIQILHQENQGQSRTLNKGWAIARGDLLGYLSADDLMDPHAIEKIVTIFESVSSPDILYPDYRLIDPKSKYIKDVQTKEFVLADLVLKMICQPGPGAIFRKEVFSKLSGWNNQLRQAPDYDFWLRASRSFQFRRYSQVLASFRIHEESQSFQAPNPLKSEEPVILMKDFVSSGFQPQLVGKENQALAQAHIFSARLHIKAWRFQSAAAHWFKALYKSPQQAFSFYSTKLILHGLLDPIRFRIDQRLRARASFSKSTIKS